VAPLLAEAALVALPALVDAGPARRAGRRVFGPWADADEVGRQQRDLRHALEQGEDALWADPSAVRRESVTTRPRA